MEPSQHLSAIRDEGSALLAAVANAPDACIQHCPDWDNTGLADHKLITLQYDGGKFIANLKGL